MDQTDDENLNGEEPHAYIHILPQKIGDKYERIVVPRSALKHFQYDNYKKNTTCYDNKTSKYVNEGQKMKCYVLYAADSLAEVDARLREGKRFRIPNNNLINSDGSMISNNSIHDARQEEKTNKESQKRAKNALKEAKKLKTSSKRETSEQILQNYLQNVNTNQPASSHSGQANYEMLEDLENLSQFSPTAVDNDEYPETTVEHQLQKSTPFALSNLNNNNIINNENSHSKCKAAINAFKIQTLHFQHLYERTKKDAETLKIKYETLLKQPSEENERSDLGCKLLAYYDHMYKYDGELVFHDQSDCVKLLNDIEFNRVAYKNAFKSAKPIQMVRHLMIGIYGYDDLSKRCIEHESNEGLEPLCPIRNEAVERELYRYLRLHKYDINLIQKELQYIKNYFHNAISTANLKIKRQE